jgi:hypothetical protein
MPWARSPDAAGQPALAREVAQWAATTRAGKPAQPSARPYAVRGSTPSAQRPQPSGHATPRTAPVVDDAPARIVIPLTSGGIDNSYLSLADHFGFFPADAIGAASAKDGTGAQLPAPPYSAEPVGQPSDRVRGAARRRRGRQIATHPAAYGYVCSIVRKNTLSGDLKRAGVERCGSRSGAFRAERLERQFVTIRVRIVFRFVGISQKLGLNGSVLPPILDTGAWPRPEVRACQDEFVLCPGSPVSAIRAQYYLT